ncbi:hypothetical protein C6495_00760 [Candidatus Poribacteria bacterium]|nr:MAG: hypothetical protein C6495_00760 [Candidatus Poribacteria bacterium]
MSHDSQDFVSLSEQDQAILLYRVGRCMAAPVVRDCQIANRSGSGDPDSMLSVSPALARDRPSPYGKPESIDMKVLADLNPSFPNPANLANLVNPAHILPILKILLLI